MSTICGLLTISTFSESLPPPVPPHPAQPVSTAATTTTAVDEATSRTSEQRLRCRSNIRYLQDANGEVQQPREPRLTFWSHHAVGECVGRAQFRSKERRLPLIRCFEER